MRRLVIIATFLLYASTAWGGFGYGRVVGGTPASSGASVVVKDSQTSTAGSGGTPGATDSLKYYNSPFVATSSYTATKIELNLRKAGTPTGTISCAIYADSSGSRGTLLATSTNSYNSSSLTTSYALKEFTLDSDVSITSGTKYHIGLVSSTISDPINTKYFQYTAGAATGLTVQRSADGTTWTNVNFNTQFTFYLYGY